MKPSVMAVSASSGHTFSKPTRSSITLIAGVGVDGDAHAGELVKHRYLVGKDSTQPNLRQVHLMPAELLSDLTQQGHEVSSGDLGENLTTEGVDLLALPTGTLLHLGGEAVVELTGLRNPCPQIDEFQEGLMRRLRHRDESGQMVRTAGVMGIVAVGGEVRPGDPIVVDEPARPHVPLVYVANSHQPAIAPGSRS